MQPKSSAVTQWPSYLKEYEATKKGETKQNKTLHGIETDICDSSSK